jgi:YVTN family beta-propeller protein
MGMRGFRAMVACALLVAAGCGDEEANTEGVAIGESQEAAYATVFPAAADGALWFANPDDGRVTRVDADSGDIAQVIDLVEPETDFNPLPHALAAGPDGDLWVTLQRSGKVARIDPATNEVAESVTLGVYPYGIAVAATDVWVTDFEAGIVARVDKATGREVARNETIDSPMGVMVTAGAVWVTGHREGTVFRLDPETAEVTGRVGSLGELNGFAADDEALWVGASSSGLVRIDPGTLQPEPVDLGGPVYGVAVGRDGIWVTTGPAFGCDETNSAVVLVDPESLAELGRAPLACAFAVAAAPDGRAVAASDAEPASLAALEWNG